MSVRGLDLTSSLPIAPRKGEATARTFQLTSSGGPATLDTPKGTSSDPKSSNSKMHRSLNHEALTMRSPYFLVLFVLLSPLLTFLASITVADETKSEKLEDVIEIVFPKTEYEFTLAEAAKGIKIDYKIEIRKDFPGVVPLPQGDSECAPPGPSGLYPFEEISGQEQRYGIRDRGMCPGKERRPGTITRATYQQSFEWDGRNWNGPSDTNQPKGKPFPPGTYDLEVSVRGEVETPAGRKPYRIAKSLKVTLKP